MAEAVPGSLKTRGKALVVTLRSAEVDLQQKLGTGRGSRFA